MLADVVDLLQCPHCPARLALEERALRCGNGHSFDVAKQGYVSLLSGQPATVPGDTAAMVAARAAFLAGGHFSAITAALAATVRSAGAIVDLGAGTGHHLAGVLEANPSAVGVAADISAYALRRAAKAHPRAGAIRCDAWRPLPLRTASVSVVINVFAPRNGGEIQRILHPDGVLVVVIPTERHLRELASAVGEVRVDPRKSDRLDAALGGLFRLETDSRVEAELTLTADEAFTAVEMGPAAWHADAAALRSRLATLPSPVSTLASVRVATFRRVSP